VRILNVCVDIEDSDSKIVSSLHSIGKERKRENIKQHQTVDV
jgi:hypothetical protein